MAHTFSAGHEKSLMTSRVGPLLISLVDAGDGYDESFNHDDEEDERFYRFRVCVYRGNGYEELPHFSRATLLPITYERGIVRAVLDYIAETLFRHIEAPPERLHRLCDDLAWAEPSWAERGFALRQARVAGASVAA
jgi:hypothetical protein